MNWKTGLLLVLAILAIALGFFALNKANQAYHLALTDIELEERNTLMTPVYDEGQGTWAYLAIIEVGITNQGPDPLTLASMSKMDDDAGFLVPLSGSKIVDKSFDYQAFVVQPGIMEIQTNPKLIKELSKTPMGASATMDLVIGSGQTKAVRFGVLMNVYDAEKMPLAQMVLLSMRFNFDNGKLRVFRRGIPVSPLS